MRYAGGIVASGVVLVASTCSGIEAQEEDLSPYLLRVTPEADDATGLDLELCAVFDGSDSGVGMDWDGELWFELDGARIEGYVARKDSRPDPPEIGGCSASLRYLLQRNGTSSLPSPGPIHAAVIYRDRKGVKHRHVWQTHFNLIAPEAPERVQRIRELYGPLRDIDRDKSPQELLIAGYYLENDVLNVYLHDSADLEAVRAKIEAALADVTPAGGLRILQPESLPSKKQMNAWIREATRPVWAAEGIRVHGASGGCCSIWNRVVIRVGTLYSAHRVREVVAQTSVPQEIVAVWVPARHTLKQAGVSANGIRSTLDMPSSVRRGEVLRIDAVWTNVSDSTVTFTYGPSLPTTIIVFTAEEEAVWASHDGRIGDLLGAEAVLAPGEEIRFTRYWELVDEDGFGLSPGDYLVQAQGDGNDHLNGRVRRLSFITAPYPLRIEP